MTARSRRAPAPRYSDSPPCGRQSPVGGGVVEVRVLGPLEVAGADPPMRVLPAKQRRLFAALVVHAGRRLSVDSLLEAVWDGSAPASARKVLQIYISQLRRRLPPELAIRTDDGGYTLEFDPQLLDSTRFERLLADGRSALADGNAALAHSLLRRALDLWRGDAFGELAYEEFARGEADRLDELRLLAVEELMEAGLRLGRHEELLA